MAVRTFESPDGAVWSVWEVIPSRMSERPSSHLPRALADGWLCFDCGTEKRRLAPLPQDWAERPEADLLFWCRAAVPVPARPGQPVACDAAPPAGASSGSAAMAGTEGGKLARV